MARPTVRFVRAPIAASSKVGAMLARSNIGRTRQTPCPYPGSSPVSVDSAPGGATLRSLSSDTVRRGGIWTTLARHWRGSSGGAGFIMLSWSIGISHDCAQRGAAKKQKGHHPVAGDGLWSALGIVLATSPASRRHANADADKDEANQQRHARDRVNGRHDLV